MGYLKKNQQTGTVFPYMVNSISQANNAEKSPKISSVTPTATQFAVKYSFAIIDCLCN